MACPECATRSSGSPQTYTVTGDEGTITFNVSRAMEIVSDGRKALKVPPELVDQILYVNVVTDEHLDHVDASFPGIAGEFQGKIMALDGAHRAAKCKRDGLDYYVYPMSEKETWSCVVLYDPDNKEGLKGINL